MEWWWWCWFMERWSRWPHISRHTATTAWHFAGSNEQEQNAVVKWKQNDNQQTNLKIFAESQCSEESSRHSSSCFNTNERAGDKFLGTPFYGALHTHVHASTMSLYILGAFSFSKEATRLKHFRNTRERMILYQKQTKNTALINKSVWVMIHSFALCVCIYIYSINSCCLLA